MGSPSGQRHPVLTFEMKAMRHFGHYVWNIITPAFGVATLAFTSFALNPDDCGDRISVALTVLLTLVAFKHSVAGELPKSSYLTLIDKYLISTMVVVSGITISHGIVCRHH